MATPHRLMNHAGDHGVVEWPVTGSLIDEDEHGGVLGWN